MSRATVELDFFGMEKDASSSSTANYKPSLSPNSKSLKSQRSFRDIQSAISKINPELLKSVITSGSVINNTPKEEQSPFPPFPLFPHLPRTAALDAPPLTAPLTIFYNGAVSVFDVARDKAETILKLAENGISKSGDSTDQKQLLHTFEGDLPITRRKSLQRFLEKRKERLTSTSPYGCPQYSRL